MSKTQDPVQILRGYPADVRVLELYDSDEEFAAALNALLPDFEYPNHSHRTIEDVLHIAAANGKNASQANENQDQTPAEANLTTFRLTSTPMVNTPGIINWARHTTTPVELLGKMFPNLPMAAVKKLAKGDYELVQEEELIKVTIKSGIPVKLVAIESTGVPYEHEADAQLFEDGTVLATSGFSGIETDDESDRLDMRWVVMPDGSTRTVMAQENGRITLSDKPSTTKQKTTAIER